MVCGSVHQRDDPTVGISERINVSKKYRIRLKEVDFNRLYMGDATTVMAKVFGFPQSYAERQNQSSKNIVRASLCENLSSISSTV